jgi:drug/metabolite transporter (DMT)-like permease
MTLSMFGYASTDAFIKFIGLVLPLSEILFIRGIIAVFFLFLLCCLRNEVLVNIDKKQYKFIFLRIFGDVGCTVLFLTALINMKLANATAILQCLPLALTFCAVIFLKEKVGWRRWSAIIFGFFGVLIIIKPNSEGFNYYSLLAVGAVFFIVLRDLTTKKLDPSIPSTFISLITAISVTSTGIIFSPLQNWVMPSVEIFFSLTATAIFLILGILFNVMCMRIGEVSFVVPFRYSIIVFAILYGVIFYNEIPDLSMIAGTVIIISTGLYTFYRERFTKIKNIQ